MSGTCQQTQTIGEPPLTVTLTCRRPVNANGKHTGKHITPDGDVLWWGPSDQYFAAQALS